MNVATQNALLDAIAELSRKYPTWRLGQLMANVAEWADQSVWDIEDECLLKTVQQHLANPDSQTSEARS